MPAEEEKEGERANEEAVAEKAAKGAARARAAEKAAESEGALNFSSASPARKVAAAAEEMRKLVLSA